MKEERFPIGEDGPYFILWPGPIGLGNLGQAIEALDADGLPVTLEEVEGP